jgi:hypothetical protein
VHRLCRGLHSKVNSSNSLKLIMASVPATPDREHPVIAYVPLPGQVLEVVLNTIALTVPFQRK